MSTPRRVLHIRASRFVGGPEHQILRYARLADTEGVTSTLASFIGDGEGDALLAAAQAQGTDVLALPAGTVAGLRALIRFLRAQPQGLICTHGYKADILGIIAGRLTHTPTASFLRGWTGEDSKVRFYEAVNRSLLRLTDRIVCLSQTQKAHTDAPESKLRLITNVVEPFAGDTTSARRDLRQALQLPAEAVVIASAGRLSPEKGTHFFIEAAKSLGTEFPHAHFVVFGDGALHASLAAEAADTDQIYFAGHRADFRRWIAGLDILVNPSLSEEMPNVVLEAMAAGVPVVATAVGGVPEIASQPSVIKLVAPQDSGAIRDAVRELLREPPSARSLGESGRQRTVNDYSPMRQQQQLLSLYSEFLPATQLQPLPATPFISIVIPVRNEEHHLGHVLQQLHDQDYPADKYEALVADGNSTDRTRQVVEEFARTARIAISVVANPKQLSSAGRNEGVLASRGEVIAFIDGHCQIPTRQLLASIADLLRTTGAACLCRPQPLHVEGNTPFQTALANTRATLIGHGRDSTIFDMDSERFVNPTSSGAIYRAEVFERIGLYDEHFDACEDVEFNHRVWRAGFAAFSSPRVAVYYSPRTSLGSLWKQLVRYGRGRCRFMRKHAEAISLPQLIPAAFVFWLAALAVAAFFAPLAAWALAGTVAFYLLVTLAFAISLSFRYGWNHLLISPAVYACIHGGLGAGFWREAFAGRKPQPGAMRDFARQPLHPGTTVLQSGPRAGLTTATSNKR